MAESSQLPLPPGPGPEVPASPATGRAPRPGRALLAALAITLGGALLGAAGGVIWAAASPRPVYVVVSRGTAAVVNPETSAFIAADGWFCLIGLAGGAVIGLLGYLLAVRRYGPVPMAGILAGAVAAAFAARWTGEQCGASKFHRMLMTARTGSMVRPPITLGAHGGLAFWPLAAAAVAGGIEAMAVLRRRRSGAGRRSGTHRQSHGLDGAGTGLDGAGRYG